MANINVTYQDMTAQATRIDTGRQDIQTKLETLRNQVQALIEAGFVTDQASGAFNESYKKFTTGAKTTIQGLEGMTSFLNQAAQSMSDMDKQLAASIRG